MSKPIQDRDKLHKSEKGLGELLVARADVAVFFDATEEILDVMTTAIVAAMKLGRLEPSASGWNAAPGALTTQALPERVRGKGERTNIDKIKPEDITASGGSGTPDDE